MPDMLFSTATTSPVSRPKVPNRAGIFNTDTGELRRFLINPAEVSVQIEAQWNDFVGMASDFEWLQWHHTSSPTITIEAAYNRSLACKERWNAGAVSAADVDAAREDFNKHHRFLLSLLYPRGNQNDLIRRSPPYVIFLWPELMALKAVVKSLTLKHSAFSSDGSPVEFTASMSLKEARSYRITSADAYRTGLMRESVSG